jgi:hypothetical protein
MSHWGPTYGEIMGAERHRKSLNTSAQDLLDALLRVIDDTGQRQYHTPRELLEVSHSSHAEAMRADIRARVVSTAWSMNVEPSKEDSDG